MKIRKSDMVKVLTGKDKGKVGKVIEIDLKNQAVLVERVNMVKRHKKPDQTNRQGGIIEKEAPINISNVMYYDEESKVASRLGAKIADGVKRRFMKKSGKLVPAKM